MRPAMATPRSALIKTSSSRSSVSSSSLRLVSTLARLSERAEEGRARPWRSPANQLLFGSAAGDVFGFGGAFGAGPFGVGPFGLALTRPPAFISFGSRSGLGGAFLAKPL